MATRLPTKTHSILGAVLVGALVAACGGPGTDDEAGTTAEAARHKHCTPTTCAAQGVQCGTIPDGCGHTLLCGPCTTDAGTGDAATADSGAPDSGSGTSDSGTADTGTADTGIPDGGVTVPPRPLDPYGWVVCSATFTPLTDAQAAALVAAAAEKRSGNTTANQYRPSATELSAFQNGERDNYGLLPVQQNPYVAYVTGGFTGTTDEIIQWGAAKWGIPADWLRAQYVQESNWNQAAKGDLTTVSNTSLYPAFSVASSTQVYQSLGITQVKWNHPDGNNTGIGTEPLRWKSTAFNVDYQAANVRFYFDNPGNKRSGWGDASYAPCQNWLSIGGWFEPYPWNNSGQQSYVASVQNRLAARPWAQPGF